MNMQFFRSAGLRRRLPRATGRPLAARFPLDEPSRADINNASASSPGGH